MRRREKRASGVRNERDRKAKDEVETKVADRPGNTPIAEDREMVLTERNTGHRPSKITRIETDSSAQVTIFAKKRSKTGRLRVRGKQGRGETPAGHPKKAEDHRTKPGLRGKPRFSQGVSARRGAERVLLALSQRLRHQGVQATG